MTLNKEWWENYFSGFWLEVQRNTRTETEIKDDKTEKKHSSMRIYTYQELCETSGPVGFENFEAYGSLDGGPFKLGSARLYLVAMRKI